MDVLSSQATRRRLQGGAAGGRGAAEAPPDADDGRRARAPRASCWCIGAGVAGLQAIATGRRLGAVVQRSTSAPAVREQVESLGATLRRARHQADARTRAATRRSSPRRRSEREQALRRGHVAEADIVITTALVPGRHAPMLITGGRWSQRMRAGLGHRRPGRRDGRQLRADAARPARSHAHGVTRPRPVNLPSTMAVHASQLYARNVATLRAATCRPRASSRSIRRDEITRGALVTHDGAVVHQATRRPDGGPRRMTDDVEPDHRQLYVFVLAVFVGYEVISKVPPMLHTPLMSATNAIHGISWSARWSWPARRARARWRRCSARSRSPSATINVVGGFLSRTGCCRCSSGGERGAP